VAQKLKSIIQAEKECFFTGFRQWLERHHIFGGSNRKHSEKYGLWVYLEHHMHNEPPEGVHHNRERDLALKRIGQAAFERTHSREKFMRIFGKNYL
jgi:hypothetical protein